MGAWHTAGRAAIVTLATIPFAASGETLEDAWRAALAADSRLEAAEARTAASDAALSAARAERYPSVTAATATSHWRDPPAFDFGATGTPGVLPLFGGDTMNLATAQVELPLYTGGALTANLEAAAAAHDGQGLEANALRQDLKLGVAEAYVGVLDGRLRFSRCAAPTATATASKASEQDETAQKNRQHSTPYYRPYHTGYLSTLCHEHHSMP
jgi:outer membrane protein TolC